MGLAQQWRAGCGYFLAADQIHTIEQVHGDVITLVARSKLGVPGITDCFNAGVSQPAWASDKIEFKRGTPEMAAEIKRWLD